MWRYGIAGTVVIGAAVGLMLASYEATNPLVGGWTAGLFAPPPPRMPRLVIPFVTEPATPNATAPAASSPSVASPPAAAPPAPPAVRRRAPSPAASAQSHRPASGAKAAPAEAERGTAGSFGPPAHRPARAPVSPVEAHLGAAQRDLMKGDPDAARMELERAETQLAFRPGRVDPRQTAAITAALGALAGGDEAGAMRELESARRLGARTLRPPARPSWSSIRSEAPGRGG